MISNEVTKLACLYKLGLYFYFTVCTRHMASCYGYIYTNIHTYIRTYIHPVVMATAQKLNDFLILFASWSAEIQCVARQYNM